VTYDAIGHRFVTFGGDTLISGRIDTTSALQFRTSLTPSEACITGNVDDDGDGLMGCDDPDCWPRCAPLCPPYTTCPVDDPRCGDGACASLESRALCPQDCM
jgi:hypothetical protein